jgi:hypothetical protein
MSYIYCLFEVNHEKFLKSHLIIDRWWRNLRLYSDYTRLDFWRWAKVIFTDLESRDKIKIYMPFKIDIEF